MLLGGVFQATGNQSPMNIPAKGRYMMADLERFARRYGCRSITTRTFRSTRSC